jgi:CheY-like chemotaxis protein
MTGWEVVEAVRTRAPAMRIIMITGSVSNLDMDRARAMSLALLPKPLRLEDLRRSEDGLPTPTAAELDIVNVVAQHDEQPHEQLSGDGQALERPRRCTRVK